MTTTCKVRSFHKNSMNPYIAYRRRVFTASFLSGLVGESVAIRSTTDDPFVIEVRHLDGTLLGSARAAYHSERA